MCSTANRLLRTSRPRSKPSENAFFARSSARSSKLTNTPASPKSRAPRARNLMPSRVWPAPGPPKGEFAWSCARLGKYEFLAINLCVQVIVTLAMLKAERNHLQYGQIADGQKLCGDG